MFKNHPFGWFLIFKKEKALLRLCTKALRRGVLRQN